MQSAIGYKQGIITKSACKIAKKLRYDNKKAQLFLLSLNSGGDFGCSRQLEYYGNIRESCPGTLKKQWNG